MKTDKSKDSKEKLRKMVYPIILESKSILDKYDNIISVETLLATIEEFKAKDFPVEEMKLETVSDYNEEGFSNVNLVVERPKTEEEIQIEVRQLEELEKFKRQEQYKNRVARERSEKELYKKLHKKYG